MSSASHTSSNDYYEVLGVSKEANDHEVSKAYHKLALRYHPDKNPENREAERQFKKVNEAYGFLRTPEKRSKYNAIGKQGFDGSSTVPQGGNTCTQASSNFSTPSKTDRRMGGTSDILLPGVLVEAHSLKATELNGAWGRIQQMIGGRVQVAFNDAKYGVKALQPANLKLIESSRGGKRRAKGSTGVSGASSAAARDRSRSRGRRAQLLADSDLALLKVPELRSRLCSLGLPASGLKAALIDRLSNARRQQELDTATAPRETCQLRVPRGALGNVMSIGERMQVNWSPHVAGNSFVERCHVIKRLPQDLFLQGDVVKAICDLHYQGCQVLPKGSLGTVVQAGQPFTVNWCPHPLGHSEVTKGQVSKCKSKEFLKKGDIVMSTRTLRYDDCIVNPLLTKGSIGKLSRVEPLSVDWSPHHAASRPVHKDDIDKCEPECFLVSGNTVKATCRLDYGEGRAVEKGALGVIVSAADPLTVDWSPQVFGNCVVTTDHIVKCKESEFLRVGDIVEASQELHYSREGLSSASVPDGCVIC